MTIDTSRKVPRGQLRHGDVVEVYSTVTGQKHHTNRACGLLNRRDGDVRAVRAGVDAHGGIQVTLPLCDSCSPFYKRVTDAGQGATNE